MVGLVIDFDAIQAVVPGDTANLYWNVSSVGLASGSPTADPVNSAPIPMFPGQPEILWGSSAWGDAPWGGSLGDPVMYFETPPVCFGLVQVQGQAVDLCGNDQSGLGAVGTFFVDSNPESPRNFTRGAWNAGTGRLTFAFTPSPQVQ